MHSNCPSVLSAFSALKISRPANDGDMRNIRPLGKPSFKGLRRTPCFARNTGLDAIFSIEDFKTEALKLTSATIVKAGYNRVWGHRPTAPISRVPLEKSANERQSILHTPNLEPITAFSPPPHPAAAPILTCLPSPKSNQLGSKLLKPESSALVDPLHASGSLVLSFSLQNAVEEQSAVAPIVTHLPSPQTSQPERERLTPADLQHPSGSRFLSFSLQKAAAIPCLTPLPSIKASQMEFGTNIVTLEQDIISFPYASSFNTTQKQFAIKAKLLHPPSGSRFLQSSPQEVPSQRQLEQGIIPHLLPQLTAAQSPASPLSPMALDFTFGSFAAEGWESPHRNVGLDLFAAEQSSYLSNFLPNTFPPAQSLLFLCPPSPPPPKRINFKPFSPEEDTVSLPPSPETASNRLDITFPFRGLDDKFPVNTLPSLLLAPTQGDFPVSVCDPNQNFQHHTVPYTPLPPTQDFIAPSPLPLALLLSPWPAAPPPSNELNIKIAGLHGYLNAENYKPQVTHFLLSRGNQVENSLIVVWQLSHVDNGGARGIMSLKALFTQLDEKVLDSERTALSSFSKLSITVPDLVKDITPYNDLLQPVEEDDSIDLVNAVDLLEFAWNGDFVVFASKFKNLSFVTLTVLNVKNSDISIEDAVTLLHSCPDLQTASLGTIRSEEDSDAVTSLKYSGVERKALPNLTRLVLESDIALHPLIRRIHWARRVTLTLTLKKEGSADIHKLPLPWRLFSNIELNCHLTPQELSKVKKVFPPITYHEMGI